MKPWLGDAIAAVTSAAGIKPCGGCQKSRELLNRGEIREGLAMIPGNVFSIARGDVQGVVGQPFRYELPAGSGIVQGAIPQGLKCLAGVLSGIPSQAGRFQLTLGKDGQRWSIAIRVTGDSDD